MAYSVYTDIQDRLGTSVPQATITSIIAQADAIIDGWLALEFMTGDTSSTILKSASIEISCAFIKQRESHIKGRPETLGVGPVSLNFGVDKEFQNHMKLARELVSAYIKKTNGDPATQSSTELEQTIVREDHKMPYYNLDQSTVKDYHDRADESGQEDENDT